LEQQPRAAEFVQPINLNRILAVDIGAGTQDILLWEAGQPMENNVKLVLPSWTTVLVRWLAR